MGMNSSIIKSDLEAFQASVKTLSDGIQQASSLWRDTKFSELSASVSSIAKQSKELIVAGDRCCNAIDRFEAIAGEKY